MLVPPPPTSSLAYSTKLLSLTTTRCFVFWCPFHTATTSAGFWLWLLFWGRPLLAFSFFAHTVTHTQTPTHTPRPSIPPSLLSVYLSLSLPIFLSPHHFAKLHYYHYYTSNRPFPIRLPSRRTRLYHALDYLHYHHLTVAQIIPYDFFPRIPPSHIR